MGRLISGWAYKRNKKNVSDRRDKMYLRNELKLKHTITFWVTSIIHLCVTISEEFILKTSIKLTYATGTTGTEQKIKKLEAMTFSICLFDGLINGGGLYISGILYSLANGWAYIWGA